MQAFADRRSNEKQAVHNTAAAFIDGVINTRGVILPIVELRI
jgi:chemotaxis signal transduction protein